MYYSSNGVKEDECRLCFAGYGKPIYKMDENEHIEYLKQFDADYIDKRLDWKIEELDLTNRARNALLRAGIGTLGEIISHSASELLALDNFGPTSLASVNNMLAPLELELAPKEDSPCTHRVLPVRKTVSKLVKNENGDYVIVKENVE